MKQTTFSDLERNNKTCMYAHLIDSSIMTLFCILQALSGLQTWGYIIIFAVLGFGPVIAEFFFWNKSHETPAIQHLVAIGFAVFYSFAIFTATNGLVFLFVIPMILIISVYNDAKYSLIINTGTIPASATSRMIRNFMLLNIFFLKYFLTPEIITHSPFRIDIFWIAWIRFNLFTKSPDMYIHSSCISRILISPYDIQKIHPLCILYLRYKRQHYPQFQRNSHLVALRM